MIDCGQDYKFPGLCAAHGSVFRGAVCEAVLIQRVRELHRPSQSTIFSHDLQQAITVTTCQHSGDPYPCPTIKVMDGER